MFNFLIFDREQWKKVAKGAAIAFVGAGIVAAGQYLLQVDFGEWNYVVIPLVSALVNIAKVSAKL